MSDTRRHLDRCVETSESRPITVSWIIRGDSECHPTSCSGSNAQAVSMRDNPHLGFTNPHLGFTNGLPTAQAVKVSGKMGLCFCPGKQHARDGKHISRSLDSDLVRLKERYGIQCVVCLLNDAELRVSYGSMLICIIPLIQDGRLSKTNDTIPCDPRNHYHPTDHPQSYSIRGYESALRRHGLEYMQHPIIECAAPDHFEPTADFVEALTARLKQGQTLAVHCRQVVGICF